MTSIPQNPIMSLVLAVVASASVLAFAAGPAEAATPGTEVSARVSVGQFELSTFEGRQAATARVVAAAERICAEGGVDSKNITEVAAYKLCVADAVVDARQQMAAIQTRTQLASR
jgi:UrcA family protein